MKLTQSTAFEQKRWNLRSLSQLTPYPSVTIATSLIYIYLCFVESVREEIKTQLTSTVKAMCQAPGKVCGPGLPGAPGPQGEKGQKGSDGMVGVKGERGIDGVSGLSGPRGEPGEKGEVGSKGETGDKGNSCQGTPLLKGEKGFSEL